MPHKDPEERRRNNRERMRLRRAGSKESPVSGKRNEMVQERLKDLQSAESLAAALNPSAAQVNAHEAIQVIGELPQDRTEQAAIKERLIRELYPGIEQALKGVLVSLGVMIDHPILGELLFKDGLEPLVRRALVQMGPVFEAEIPRGGSLAPEAILQMNMAQAKLGALMCEIAFRGLQVTDPTKLPVKDLINLAMKGSQLEQSTRKIVINDEANDSARKYVHAMLSDPEAIDLVNQGLAKMAKVLDPSFMGEIIDHDPPAADATP